MVSAKKGEPIEKCQSINQHINCAPLCGPFHRSPAIPLSHMATKDAVVCSEATQPSRSTHWPASKVSVQARVGCTSHHNR